MPLSSTTTNSRDTPGAPGWFPVLASVALFLITTAVAQWARAFGDATGCYLDYDQEDEDDENVDRRERELEDLRQWYRSRRVLDRLSYENLADPTLMISSGVHPVPSNQSMTTAKSTTPLANNDNQEKNESTWRRGNTRDLAPALDCCTFDPPGLPSAARERNTVSNVTNANPRYSEWDLQLQRPSANMSDRSSFVTSTSTPSPIKNTNKDKDNANANHHPPFVSLSSSERRDSNVVAADLHPNADYDFHPKNRNWRHFEHFNELDSRRTYPIDPTPHPKPQPTPSYTQPSSRKPEREKEPGQAACGKLQRESSYQLDSHTSNDDAKESLNARMLDTDDEDEDGDGANSISSSGSESSEEQFVWMKHPHRPKISSPKTNEDGWPGAFRKRVPSFLNLFTLEDSVNAAAAPEHKSVVDETMEGDSSTSKKPVRSPTKTHHAASLSDSSLPSTIHGTFSRESNPPPNNVRKTIRRNSLPAISSNHATSDKVSGVSTSFPRALQRMWSRRSSLGSFYEPKKRGIPRQDPCASPPPITTNSNTHHRELRAQYNATIMPAKVILVRHGQSMGNINELLYATTPDNAMPLTQLGWEQARAAGTTLKNKILTPNETVHFIVSPYVRTVETFHGMVSAWCDPKEFAHIANKEKRIKAWYRRLMEMGLTWNEDSRIREQDFGNYQDPETIRKAKQERHRFGIFYYRYPHGESASDVFDRVSTFLDSLWRSFEMNKSRNYVLVTHGISIRVLLARYFRYTIDQFNILANPRNCEMIILGHNGQGRLELQGRCALELGPKEPIVRQEDEEKKEQGKDETNKNKADDSLPTSDTQVQPRDGELHVTGYKFHKRLRILPKHAIRKVKIRISPDD